jgi:hypothetical protein
MASSFFRYCRLVFHVALSHSLHAAHSIILVLIIVAGLLVYLFPAIEIVPDLHGWEVAALVLGGIVAVRLLLAPYWIWLVDKAALLSLETEVSRLKEIDYSHGLALLKVQPALDPSNLENTLEFRLELRNLVQAPLKFFVERLVQRWAARR